MRSPFNLFAPAAVFQAEIENLYKTNFMGLSTRLVGLFALQCGNQQADDIHAHTARRDTFSIHTKTACFRMALCVDVCIVYLYASIHIVRRVE